MPNCKIHPTRKASLSTSFGDFCSTCEGQIKTAQTNVSKHVEPKECFIEYKGSAVGWGNIGGTGCAHWVSHQLNIISPFKSLQQCQKNYLARVKDVVSGRQMIDNKDDVQAGDIWADYPHLGHCGLVVRIFDDTVGNKKVKRITIKHCSSGQGGVFENDFDIYFKGHGKFYR